MAGIGVPLTDAEWSSVLHDFPLLEGFRDQCLKTDEPTPKYNCISWSIGRTYIWIDPPPTQAEFEALRKHELLLFGYLAVRNDVI
jgi:hypothetical protein